MVVHGAYPIGEPRVTREARVALEHGFEVEVLALRAPGEAAKETVDGVYVRRLPLHHYRGRGLGRMLFEYLSFAALASGWLALHPRRYKIVQVHNPPDFLVAAGLLPKLFRSRLIFDIHDLSPDMFLVRFDGRRGSRVVDRLLRVTERIATGIADAVITVHEPYRRELVERGVKAEKVTVVMNGLDEDLLPNLESVPESDVFRVVYHGTITHWYGVETIIEAAAEARNEIPDLRIELYGDGDSLPAVRQLVATRELLDRVSISGRYLPHHETLRAVSHAAVGVIPNLENRLNHYALSSKLFEYVMLGIPVVCSRLPTLEEHFSDEELLFFTPGDAAELAAALVSIARNPADAQARAERARSRCEEYRWHRSAERYAAVLESLL
jgi:glycosyltransferase involved in cell wall biosynthesis